MLTIVDKAAIGYLIVMAIVLLTFFVSGGCQSRYGDKKYQTWDLKDPKKIIWYGATDGPITWENPQGVDFRGDYKAYITAKDGRRFLVHHQMLVELD